MSKADGFCLRHDHLHSIGAECPHCEVHRLQAAIESIYGLPCDSASSLEMKRIAAATIGYGFAVNPEPFIKPDPSKRCPVLRECLGCSSPSRCLNDGCVIKKQNSSVATEVRCILCGGPRHALSECPKRSAADVAGDPKP